MGINYVGESLTREALGYVSIIVGDAVERNHLLSELSTLFIYNLTTMERGRREEGIVMAWEAI